MISNRVIGFVNVCSQIYNRIILIKNPSYDYIRNTWRLGVRHSSVMCILKLKERICRVLSQRPHQLS